MYIFPAIQSLSVTKPWDSLVWATQVDVNIELLERLKYSWTETVYDISSEIKQLHDAFKAKIIHSMPYF